MPSPASPPLGSWIWIDLAWEHNEPFLGFVYFDKQAGLSAKGGPASDPSLAEQPSVTVRLGQLPFRALTAQEAAQRGLPARPAWVVHYGPQPPADAPWRHDPRLKGRFHPSFPDDLQAIVHDGEPRRTGRAPELCWVRLDGAGGTLGAAAVYSGRLLNQPRQLATAQQGDALLVLVSASLPHPVRVEARYLEERARWSVRACDKCGADEGLDPPSVMARTRFADAPPDAEMRAFSAFCALCGGVQIWQFTG